LLNALNGQLGDNNVISPHYLVLFTTKVEKQRYNKQAQNKKLGLTKINKNTNTSQQFNIKQTLKAVKSFVQVEIVNNTLWSQSIQLCKEFFSSFFYEGAWEKD